MTMSTTVALRIFLAVVTTVAPGNCLCAGERSTCPFVLGGSEDVDACEGGGVIVGLNPRGDGFLSVRSGPAAIIPKWTGSTTAMSFRPAAIAEHGWR